MIDAASEDFDRGRRRRSLYGVRDVRRGYQYDYEYPSGTALFRSREPHVDRAVEPVLANTGAMLRR